MTRALYGRMARGTCVHTDFGYVGCFKDVLFLMERRQCIVGVPDREMSSLKPCNQDLKLYLEAGYRCMKVHQATKKCDSQTSLNKLSHYQQQQQQQQQQHHYNKQLNNDNDNNYINSNNNDDSNKMKNNKISLLPNEIQVTNTAGYLPSILTAESGCGSHEHPWIIRALPGQKVRLKLIDFSMKGTENGGEGGGGSDQKMYLTNCSVCAIVRDALMQTGTSLCRNYSRNSHVYTSLSHVIKLRIIIGRENDVTPQFVFIYEGRQEECF
ncbi:hypothetical protein HELRODRAFT_166292 [Helobdella robusta]|uniref:SUEL-type lectin domain-containing protein n=1 Tax=Helobdella robusta TaxID=6412 RepID=T1EXZ6_HELRO|nr:hypothetical protein HELRODRAFT_166292 [Helobdella robusta]ESN90600.1 hypothetical protein HELRODRAFT_166292 [Helobdella robusta]